MRTLVWSVVLLGLLGNAERAESQIEENSENDPPSAVEKPCRGALDVHVVDDSTHEPVAGAMVVVGEIVALTEDDGHSIVRGLCRGPVTVEASRVDYQTGVRDATVGSATKSVELELRSLASEEVIVIEGDSPATDLQATASISGAELERKRGRSFSETLAEIPGVAQLGSASGVAKPIIRGQFGRRLVLLVDSVRHRGQEWGLDHAPEIDPFIAEKLTVVRGAAGVRYGSDAIGGVILVEPVALRRDFGTVGVAHLVGNANGSGGSVAARFQSAPRMIPGLAWHLEGSIKRLAASRAPTYALANTGVQEWNVGGTVGYRLKDSDFKLSYRHYQARLGVCRCLSIGSSEDFLDQLERDEPIGADQFDDDFEIERPYQSAVHDQLLARARFRPKALGTITATYALQWDQRKEFAIVRTATGPQFDFRLWTHDFDVVLNHKPIHLNNRLHLRGAAGVAAVAQFHNFSGLPLVPDHRAFGSGLFATERLLAHDFELEIGLRFDHLRRRASIERRDFLRLVRSDQLTEDACESADADPVVCRSTFNTVSASVGGLYQLADPLSIKLELSTTSRAPNPDEQYLNGTSPTLPVLGLGKPDLDPETTTSASITASFRGDDVAVELSGYGNLTSDYIYFAPAIGPDGKPILDVLVRGTFPRFVTRPVDAIFYGADGGITGRPLSWLELGGHFSVVRAKNRTDNSRLVFVPSDRLRGFARWHREELAGIRKLYAQVGGTFVAKQIRFDLAADLAEPPDAYFLLDAEVGGEFSLGNQPVRVGVVGHNLLNQRYRDYTSLLRYFADQPGRQASVRLTMPFGD